MQTGGVEFTAFTFLLWQKSAVFAWKTAQLALMRPGMWFHSSQDRRHHHHRSPPLNFPCCFPSNGQHLGGVPGPYRLARLLRSVSPPPSTLRVHRDSRSSGSLPGSHGGGRYGQGGGHDDRPRLRSHQREHPCHQSGDHGVLQVGSRRLESVWAYFLEGGGTSEPFQCVFAFGKQTSEISCYFFFKLQSWTLVTEFYLVK